MSLDKWVCEECGEVCTEYLSAPNPFAPEEAITACPHCRTPESLVGACHADGCKEQASSGELWPDGVYRSSCHRHSHWAGLRAAEQRAEAVSTTVRDVDCHSGQGDSRADSETSAAFSVRAVKDHP